MSRSGIIGILFVFILIGVIAALLINTSTYQSFEEAFEKPNTKVTVNGFLSKENLIENNGTSTTFFMSDKKENVKKVIIDEALPERFSESEEITVTGYAHEEKNIFVAKKVLLKCPSKYEEDGGKEGEYTIQEFNSNN
jgi:cytochrome c-type biogenesis protein CcmE